MKENTTYFLWQTTVGNRKLTQIYLRNLSTSHWERCEHSISAGFNRVDSLLGTVPWNLSVSHCLHVVLVVRIGSVALAPYFCASSDICVNGMTNCTCILLLLLLFISTANNSSQVCRNRWEELNDLKKGQFGMIPTRQVRLWGFYHTSIIQAAAEKFDEWWHSFVKLQRVMTSKIVVLWSSCWSALNWDPIWCFACSILWGLRVHSHSYKEAACH